jgi:hypothetical protein
VSDSKVGYFFGTTFATTMDVRFFPAEKRLAIVQDALQSLIKPTTFLEQLT